MMVRCAQCDVENPVNHIYCSNCGARLVPAIMVSEDHEIPEKELRDFVVRVCDQHFGDRELIKRSLTIDITKDATSSLETWVRLIESMTRNFLGVVAIVVAVAAFLGFKTYRDIKDVAAKEMEKVSGELRVEADSRRKEFQEHVDKAQALRDHLQKIIQITRFVSSDSNSNILTPELKRHLEATIFGYRDYLIALRIVPLQSVLEIHVDPKWANMPGFEADRNRLQLDPYHARDEDLVCRFYSASLFPTMVDLNAIRSGLAYYFPCSWQNDPRFAEKYANLPTAARHIRLDERDLKTPRRLSELREPFQEEAWGEVWGATFWEMRETLGQERADKLIARTVLEFTPSSRGSEEEHRFVEELLKNARYTDGGKWGATVRAIFEKRGWKFP